MFRRIKNRWINYLERLIEFNQREFGYGSLSLETFNKLARRKS